MAVVVSNSEVDYAIKPQNLTPAVDTSDWPLLLKSYDKRKDQVPTALVVHTLIMSICTSPCPHRSFHSHSQRLHASEARPQILHQLRCHQP